MTNRSIGLDDQLYDYLLSVSLREPELWGRLRAATAEMPEARMQIAPEQGQFMHWLVAALGVSRAVEVGTFTGYSALCIASALPASGRLVCCDSSEEWTSIARRYWREAGLEQRIELRLGPATDTLAALLDEGKAGTVDLMFIDADKESYLDYYEAGLRLLRVGGVMLVDNTLWSGRVVDDDDQQPSTKAVRLFNEALREDPRIDLSILPVGDGLTLCRRR